MKFEDILDSVGQTNLKYEFIKHDDKGFPIEYKLIKGENAVNRMVCSFEKDSKKVLSYDKELLVDRYTTFYDNEKNVISEKLEWLYVEDTIITYNRKIDNLIFDNKGNWIKRTIKEIEYNRQWTEERRISYH